MSRRTLALAALSGLLLAASFPDLDLNVLAWLCLVPLFLALRGLTPRQGFQAGFVSGIVFFAGTIHWVFNSVHVYGNIPLVPASLITLLLSAYCALYPALFGAIVARLRTDRPSLVILAAPAAWTALELARTYVFTGFPWALLGYTQYRALPVIQVVDITGVYGISFLVVLVNAAAAGLIEDRKRMVPALAVLALLGAVAGYGAMRLHELPAGAPLRVAVVQGNIAQDKKWDKAFQAEVVATYRRLTGQALEQRPDVIIWPETATPFYFGGAGKDDSTLSRELRQFVRASRTPLLIGSPFYERRPDRTYLLRNSAYLLDGTGETAAVYHKLHLVPFGEYVPLKHSLLFFVNKLVQAAGDFQSGTGHTVMTARSASSGRDVPIATVICYEIIFPDLVRRFVNEGATVMTTITNDAWFGRTSAPRQHFTMAVFRAVENRVPVARAANTGISGFIDSRGRIVGTTGVFTEAFLTRDLVPGAGLKTFYTRHGDVFAWLCVLASLVLPALPAKKEHQPRMDTDQQG